MRPDNRTALLRGARHCLDTQGYARTRARDVASAAGVSTAAIGYHFGSVDRLLVEAIVDGIAEWSAAAGLGPDGSGPRPLVDVCRAWMVSLEQHRGVLAASFELLAQSAMRPEVATHVRTTMDQARAGLVEQVAGASGSPAAGPALYALLSGLIVQHLVDGRLPPAEDVVDALRAVVG